MKKEMSKLWLFYVINKLFKNLDLLYTNQQAIILIWFL